MKVVVSGALSNVPFSAGMAWDRAHYVLGLVQLGHDVAFVEHLEPANCLDAMGRETSFGRSLNRRQFTATTRALGIHDRAALLYGDERQSAGLSYSEVMCLVEQADLLINISGHLSCSSNVMEAARRRAYIDADPVWTQLWTSEYDADLHLKEHDVFLTAGLNIGTAASPIPDCGVRWHGFLPPIVLDLWPYRPDHVENGLTTVASLYGFADVQFGGSWYTSKYTEFERFATLPQLSGHPITAALGTHCEDDVTVEALRKGGWEIRDARCLNTTGRYQEFIQRSSAEVSVAQNAYVRGRSGWFSERSAEYLASGKPVLAQSTGLEDHLPTGCGFLTFADADGAVDGIHAILSDYTAHAAAARSFAERFLDARSVLTGVLDVCLS